MRTSTLLLAAASVLALGACSRTSDGDVVIDRPSDIDVQTTKDTLHMPSVTTRTDTVNSPVIGVQKDTIVVSKPVIGTQKKAVKVPEIKKP
jgi:hypothetical protein